MDGRQVRIAPSVCGCGDRVFFVLVGVSSAEREGSECGSRAFIGGSEEYWNEGSWEGAEPGAAGCPCGSEEFEAAVAVAFSLGDGGAVRWVTVGLGCVKDGFCGVYAGWKIDYGPTDRLLTMVQILAPSQEDWSPRIGDQELRVAVAVRSRHAPSGL
ncbi:hypothetical protein [Streptomyces sp. NPDC090021]|uniref:hypothetical protein n=1 Tax=Streptomyces sp. NPDC090021 TaxID=3365919 RepID=UPI0037FE4D2B